MPESASLLVPMNLQGIIHDVLRGNQLGDRSAAAKLHGIDQHGFRGSRRDSPGKSGGSSRMIWESLANFFSSVRYLLSSSPTASPSERRFDASFVRTEVDGILPCMSCSSL